MCRAPDRRSEQLSTPSDTPLVRGWRKHRRPERPPFVRRLVITAAVAAVAVGAAIWFVVRPGGSHGASVESSFARCTYGGYVAGRCGSIAVPADPLRPDAGTIDLRVAILPATVRPAAGALFYLEGGPGGAATRAAVEVNALFAVVGRHRDIVMIDQRGTGGSSPLVCPDERVRARNATAVTAYLRRCFSRLHGDPRLDTTSVAADDIEAVRRELGYGKIDLYGGSYGATVAQVYLQRHPGSVRSVVLDGGSLPDVRVYDVSARNAERALDTQLARCARARHCHHDYPHSRKQLAQLLQRGPRRVVLPSGPVVLRRDDVAWTVAALSETADGAATIPYAVDAAARDDYTALARAYSDALGPDLDRRARLAMFWVTLCSEPWAGFHPVATARAGAGSYLAAAAVARARLFRQACRVVPKGRVQSSEGSLGSTNAPVLLLAGGADPLDPAANLRGWRRAFPDGRLVVVPGAGHGTIEYPCVQGLVARFIAKASADGLDTACVHVSLPPFETG
jgi:pimeloyl-ACP methyl ester carboxylesterase